MHRRSGFRFTNIIRRVGQMVMLVLLLGSNQGILPFAASLAARSGEHRVLVSGSAREGWQVVLSHAGLVTDAASHPHSVVDKLLLVVGCARNPGNGLDHRLSFPAIVDAAPSTEGSPAKLAKCSLPLALLGPGLAWHAPLRAIKLSAHDGGGAFRNPPHPPLRTTRGVILLC